MAVELCMTEVEVVIDVASPLAEAVGAVALVAVVGAVAAVAAVVAAVGTRRRHQRRSTHRLTSWQEPREWGSLLTRRLFVADPRYDSPLADHTTFFGCLLQSSSCVGVWVWVSAMNAPSSLGLICPDTCHA
jgi:hypothetical protein